MLSEDEIKKAQASLEAARRRPAAPVPGKGWADRFRALPEIQQWIARSKIAEQEISALAREHGETMTRIAAAYPGDFHIEVAVKTFNTARSMMATVRQQIVDIQSLKDADLFTPVMSDFITRAQAKCRDLVRLPPHSGNMRAAVEAAVQRYNELEESRVRQESR